jgi:predicted nucleic acid-binding protein
MTKSKAYLLDCNVPIALATPEHSLNERAAAWFRNGHRFATCPITQGALVRFHLRAGVGATAESAKLLLESISSLARHEFWRTMRRISICQPQELSGIGR